MSKAESTESNDEAVSNETLETETPSGETPPEVKDADEEVGEVVVTIGEESPPSEEEEEANRAPEWVRELRKASREKDKRIRELEAQAAKPVEKTDDVATEPTLEGCDYDADRFKADFTKWHAGKQTADAKVAAKRAAEEDERKAWQSTLDAYGTAKTALKVKDFDDAEDALSDVLSVTQQGIILHGAENPALVVYALGRNSAAAKKLSSITDPVQFAAAIGRMESQLKVTPKNSPPAPEKTVKGGAVVPGAADAALDKLRADAAKTGDYTKVLAHKAKQKAVRGK